ncbi:MAG: hypothetical protein IMW89_03370 [Ktedonobacteraceae bacterium]|nr:hypothetical protein [Ktedonobacteraceae bacterium]
MQRSTRLLNGQSVLDANIDIDDFNASAVAHYQAWEKAVIEEKFATTLSALERFIRDLPESALENEWIRRWLHIEAIDHYEDHRLPNGTVIRVT